MDPSTIPVHISLCKKCCITCLTFHSVSHQMMFIRHDRSQDRNLFPTWHQQRIMFYQTHHCKPNCFMWHSGSDQIKIDIICFLSFPVTIHKSRSRNITLDAELILSMYLCRIEACVAAYSKKSHSH